MADDSLALFDLFDDVFPTTERVLFPRRNPFDEYDEKKFRERFRLSKSVVSRLVEEVMNRTTRHNTTARGHGMWVGLGSGSCNCKQVVSVN